MTAKKVRYTKVVIDAGEIANCHGFRMTGGGEIAWVDAKKGRPRTITLSEC